MKQMCRRSEGKSLAVCRSMLVAAFFGGISPLAFAQTPAFNPANFTEQYCLACHDDGSKVAGISFENVDWKNPGKSGELLEKAIHKVGTGEMPPPGMPHPSAADVKSFTGWLVTSLDQYGAAHPNPGGPPSIV
ncbi:MAG: c-type cytochrome domain-containing protein [Ignavibacteriota bacterium]